MKKIRMNLKISSILLTLLIIINLSNSSYIKEVLDGFSKYFYSLSYDKKQNIVNEAAKELQFVFPEGMSTLSLPETVDLETCKSTLQKAVKQNHEWYLLAMGQYTQLKFYNNFLNDKVTNDLQEILSKASKNENNGDSIIVDGVLYNKQQISQLISDAQALREENVQLRNALSSLQSDLERSTTTIEELKLEAQLSSEEAIRAKSDMSKVDRKLSVCRRNEYNLKKIVYECKRGGFSKFKSALSKPFRSLKLKKSLGKEGYKLYKQKKSVDSKKRKELIKNVKKDVRKSKKDKRKKLMNKSISPTDDTPLPSSVESSLQSDKSDSKVEKSTSKSSEQSDLSALPASLTGLEESLKSRDTTFTSVFEGA